MYLWQVTGRLNLSNVKEAYFTIGPKLKTNKQTKTTTTTTTHYYTFSMATKLANNFCL